MFITRSRPRSIFDYDHTARSKDKHLELFIFLYRRADAEEAEERERHVENMTMSAVSSARRRFCVIAEFITKRFCTTIGARYARPSVNP